MESQVILKNKGQMSQEDKQKLVNDIKALSSSGSLTIARSEDKSIANSASIEPDGELEFEVGAGETWVFRFDIFVEGAPGDIRVLLSNLGGLTGTISYQINQQNTTSIIGREDFTTQNNLVLANGKQYIAIMGVLRSTTAGKLALEWAQRIGDVTPTTMYDASFLQATKV